MPPPIEEFPVPEIEFFGEQDGPIERRLKKALAAQLGRDPTVQRAYLARVRANGTEDGVMLALLTEDDEDSEALVEQAGAIFASIFNAKSHLDILFLSDERDVDIRRVCAAFYQRPQA
jgi:SseB protein C-terminal domain